MYIYVTQQRLARFRCKTLVNSRGKVCGIVQHEDLLMIVLEYLVSHKIIMQQARPAETETSSLRFSH